MPPKPNSVRATPRSSRRSLLLWQFRLSSQRRIQTMLVARVGRFAPAVFFLSLACSSNAPPGTKSETSSGGSANIGGSSSTSGGNLGASAGGTPGGTSSSGGSAGSTVGAAGASANNYEPCNAVMAALVEQRAALGKHVLLVDHYTPDHCFRRFGAQQRLPQALCTRKLRNHPRQARGSRQSPQLPRTRGGSA